MGVTNSDLAFKGHFAIQGNYNGIQIWDIADPSRPSLVVAYVCPASQSDVSVYENLLFVSGEGLGGRLDCGTQGVGERSWNLVSRNGQQIVAGIWNEILGPAVGPVGVTDDFFVSCCHTNDFFVL